MDRSKKHQGFALVIALSLMALIVLLIVSLSTSGNLQQRMGYAHEQKEKAREQALYGLRLALGQLTDLAGDDRRSTGRSDLISVTPIKEPYWTGVWNGTSVNWLVSIEADHPVTPLSFKSSGGLDPQLEDSTILLVKEMVEGEVRAVNVPLVIVREEAVTGRSVPVGRYAYWIGDEGIKASIQARDLTDYAETRLTSIELRQRANTSAFLPGHPTSLSDEGLMRGVSLDQLRSEGIAIEGNVLGDWTLHSRGLLTNPEAGGLKINLERFESLEKPRFEDVFSRGAIARILDLVPPLDGKGIGRPYYISTDDYRSLPQGEPYLHLAPIVTEVATRFSVFEKSGKPALRYATELELWNPYAVPMLYREDDTRAFKVNILGLPTIRWSNLTQKIEEGPTPIDEMNRPGIQGDRGGNDMWISISKESTNYVGASQLKPGEVYRVTEPDAVAQPEGLWKDPQVDLGEVGRWNQIRIEGMLPEETAGLYFQLVQSGLQPEDEPLTDPVYSVGPVLYDRFEYSFETPLDGGTPHSYLRKRSGVDIRDSRLFAFHLGLAELEPLEMSDVLYHYDLRRPEVVLSEKVPSTAYRSASRDPLKTALASNELFPQEDIFRDIVQRDSKEGTYSDVRLYDYPIKDPVSIADLRHLSFKDMPPLALGSPEGGQLNQGFDRYFYSTVPEDWIEDPGNSVEGEVFAHSSLERIRPGPPRTASELRSASAAQYFYLRGAFNLNSTNISAWTAVLRQSFEERGWRYRDINGFTQTIAAKAMLFRFNQSADRNVVIPYQDGHFPDHTTGSLEGRNGQTRQGFRWLEPEHIDALAKSMVAELKQKGKAFTSLESFLADGLLARAIEQSGINEHMLAYGSTYLRQSDLMAALSLVATVRSDTFVIRSYGDAINSVTGQVEARATLEAVVQRIYDYEDGSAVEAFPSSEEPLLRRFRVIGFRWLTPDERVNGKK